MSDQPQNSIPDQAPIRTSDTQAGAGAPRSGTIAWALGFLIFLPIPLLNLIVTGIVHLITGLGQRKHGGLAAQNGVRAANWGLTLLCWPVLMALTVLVAVLTGSPAEGGGVVFTPAMEALVFTMFGLYFLIVLVALVYTIIGTVQANKGARVRLPVIPFLRARQG